MEGTMSEIRLFAGTFAPQGWMFCQGQSLAISQWDALYALLGTTYGGDGIQTFNLPNLQSRVAVGTGTGPGLQPYDLGETGGVESLTLTTAQMAAHTHFFTASESGSLTPKVNNSATGNTDAADGNYLSVAPTNVYANAADGGMAEISGPVSGTISLTAAGGSTPHDNIQPVMALNYIICVEGIFPSRN